MSLYTFPPHPELAEFVDAIWVQELEAADGDPLSLAILPGITPVICIQYGSAVTSDSSTTALRSAVTGLQTQLRTYRAQGFVGSVIARFTPWGAAHLFNHSMRDLADGHYDLRELVAAERVAQLEEQLQEVASAGQRATLMQAFLTELIRDRNDPLIQSVVQTIRCGGGMTAMGDIAVQHGISLRQLQRRFIAEIGLTPKIFARIVRFQNAVQMHRRGNPFIDSAYDSGYCDQAHFINECRALTGHAPGELFTKPSSRLADFFNEVRDSTGRSQAVFV